MSKRWLDVVIGFVFGVAVGLIASVWFEDTLISPVTQPQPESTAPLEPDEVQVIEVFKFEGSLEGTFTDGSS